ncbi:MAG: NADH-quinone oxidoreductase subunit NuoH [Deltaproteobacteria bacterium]|nr:MAG: NADH-quinone oxidoreductase subunit NuoH [Deltaproteobacteria bacterium]
MELVYFLIETMVKVVVVFGVLMGTVAYLTLVERKVLGHIQVRYGPNRVGPFGLFQPIADGIKAFFKEDVVPAKADKALFVIAPMISIVAALSLFAVIPFGGKIDLFGRTITLAIADIDIGLLYILGIASLGEFGVVLGGWSGYNKYGLIGALRAAAQMISYEVALGLMVIGVLMISGTLNLVQIVQKQAGWHWNVFYQPFAFIFYMVCAIAEINRSPFDMPEAEAELACGFNIEYSSMKFALFFMGEYAHLLAVCAIATTLFLGGWHGPFLPPSLSWIWFVAKTGFLVYFCIWERGTFPRLRYDQIMKLGWKVLLPLALANIFFTGLVMILKGT